MIILDQIAIRAGRQLLLDSASCTIHAGQRVGVTGKNGCGKSTLFSLIKGEIEADSGTLTMPVNQVIAEVRQETPSETISALDYCLQGDAELIVIQKAIQEAESTHQAEKIVQLHEQLGNIDGYTATSRAAKLLRGAWVF